MAFRRWEMTLLAVVAVIIMQQVYRQAVTIEGGRNPEAPPAMDYSSSTFKAVVKDAVKADTPNEDNRKTPKNVKPPPKRNPPKANVTAQNQNAGNKGVRGQNKPSQGNKTTTPPPKTSKTPPQEPKTGNSKKPNSKKQAAAKSNVTNTSNTTALSPTNAGLLPEAMNGTTSNTSLSLSSAAAETFLDTTNNNATETAVPNLTNETISNMTLSQEATNETATTNTTVPNETVINETVINATLPAAVESPPEANTTASVPGEATNETSTSNVTSPLAAESMPQETSNGTTTGNMTLAVPPTIAESTEPQPQDQQLPPPAPVPTPGEATNETASNVTGSVTTAEYVPQETMNGTTSNVTSPLPLALAEVSGLEQLTNATAGNMTLPLPATDVESTAPEANDTNVSNATLTTNATNAESIPEEPENQEASPASAVTNDGASGKSIGNIAIDQYLANCSEAMAQISYNGKLVKTSTHPMVRMSVYQQKDDQIVSKSIIKSGCYSCHILNATLSALDANPDSIFLDIGANIGLFGMTAAARGHSTYSFEPIRNNWVRTCESFQSNSPVVREHMTLFQTALSSSGPQLIHFEQQWKNQPAHVVVKPTQNEGQLDLPKNGTQGVDWGVAITLDSLQDFLPNDKPVVIKMDVVGHECEVFAGAMEYLSRVSIVHLIMEFAPHQVTKKCPNQEAIFKLLTETHGLSPYRWDEKPNLRWVPLDINKLEGWTARARAGPYDVEWSKQTPDPDLKAT